MLMTVLPKSFQSFKDIFYMQINALSSLTVYCLPSSQENCSLHHKMLQAQWEKDWLSSRIINPRKITKRISLMLAVEGQKVKKVNQLKKVK